MNNFLHCLYILWYFFLLLQSKSGKKNLYVLAGLLHQESKTIKTRVSLNSIAMIYVYIITFLYCQVHLFLHNYQSIKHFFSFTDRVAVCRQIEAAPEVSIQGHPQEDLWRVEAVFQGWPNSRTAPEKNRHHPAPVPPGPRRRRRRFWCLRLLFYCKIHYYCVIYLLLFHGKIHYCVIYLCNLFV